MKTRKIAACLALSLAAAAAAAVKAPAEVVDNLEFFSDLEMLLTLDILEGSREAAIDASSAAPAGLPSYSSGTVSVSVSTVSVRTSSAPPEGL